MLFMDLNVDKLQYLSHFKIYFKGTFTFNYSNLITFSDEIIPFS